MADKSAIEWTDATVNFWWGCTKVGTGCDHCYAETWAKRSGGAYWGAGVPRRKIGSAMTLLHRLDNGYSKWAADATCVIEAAKAFGLPVPNIATRRRVFIQSMSDLFDLEVPVEWFDEAWATIFACDRLDIQLVTKRVSAVEKRIAEVGSTWPPHAGLIITVCNQKEADRDVARLLALKAKLGIPWVGLSAEPLLGPIELGNQCGIDWVIAGGESGAIARPMHPDWARSLRDQCAAADVPFFFKQWGEWAPGEWMFNLHDDEPKIEVKGRVNHLRSQHRMIWIDYDQSPEGRGFLKVGKAAAGRLLDGVEHNAMPVLKSVRP